MSDGRELARHEGNKAPALASEARFDQTIQMVREAMLNPAVDAEKAKVMADLLNNQEDRARASEFNRDLNAAIMEMPVITKGGIITIPPKDGKPGRTQGRFARFEDIDRVVRPILQRHNLAIRFEVGDQNNMTTVCPIISHANGHTERGGAMRLPLDKSGAKNDVQGVGSAVSYGKRYTMCALLNIITEGSDDDGSLGKYAIDMPHERKVTVLEEAEDAHERGLYAAWWGTLGVKDRAWMVAEGHHNRLGAGLALPGASPAPPPPPAQRRQPDPPPPDDEAADGRELRADDPPPPEKTARKKTPTEWVAGFKAEISRVPNKDALDVYMDGKRDALARLKESNEPLWDECDQAYRDRLADFLEA